MVELSYIDAHAACGGRAVAHHTPVEVKECVVVASCYAIYKDGVASRGHHQAIVLFWHRDARWSSFLNFPALVGG